MEAHTYQIIQLVSKVNLTVFIAVKLLLDTDYVWKLTQSQKLCHLCNSISTYRQLGGKRVYLYT